MCCWLTRCPQALARLHTLAGQYGVTYLSTYDQLWGLVRVAVEQVRSRRYGAPSSRVNLTPSDCVMAGCGHECDCGRGEGHCSHSPGPSTAHTGNEGRRTAAGACVQGVGPRQCCVRRAVRVRIPCRRYILPVLLQSPCRPPPLRTRSHAQVLRRWRWADRVMRGLVRHHRRRSQCGGCCGGASERGSQRRCHVS